MFGAIRYYSFDDQFSPEPVETLIIEAGHFAVFPPETWHLIEAVSDEVVFNVDFLLIHKYYWKNKVTTWRLLTKIEAIH